MKLYSTFYSESDTSYQERILPYRQSMEQDQALYYYQHLEEVMKNKGASMVQLICIEMDDVTGAIVHSSVVSRETRVLPKVLELNIRAKNTVPSTKKLNFGNIPQPLPAAAPNWAQVLAHNPAFAPEGEPQF